jgi:Phage integrase family
MDHLKNFLHRYPFIFLPKKIAKRLALPQLVIDALRQLPSYQNHDYLFPARPNVRYREVSKFQKPHAWDIGKRFRRICGLAKIKDLRVHDLRHFATTMLFIEGVSDAIIRKMTGHRSEELERYKHLSPEFSKQTTELIAGKLVEELENTELGTFWSQSSENEKVARLTTRKLLIIKRLMAESTGLEPATSNVTGSNSLFRIWLNYKQNRHLPDISD